MRKRTPQKWTEEDRQTVLRTMARLTPEQQAQFPEEVRHGNRSFTIEEKWLLDEFYGMQPGRLAMERKGEIAPTRVGNA